MNGTRAVDRLTCGVGSKRRGRNLFLVSLLAFLPTVTGCWVEIEEEGDSNVQGAVETMLTESAAAWNRGELDGFMDDYMRSASTTYIGAEGPLAGFDRIRERYAPLFEPGAQRDNLRFEDIRVRRLAAIEAIATARRVLARGDSITGSGPFTLVLRHTSGGWKIIHHHSSSDASPAPAVESS